MAIHQAPTGEEAPRAWFLFHPDDIPERWRGRGVPMVLIPLMPDEVGFALGRDRMLPGVDPEDEPLLHLIARGLTSKAMSRELRLSLRAVQRRIGRLRARFGLRSNTELASFLAERGF